MYKQKTITEQEKIKEQSKAPLSGRLQEVVNKMLRIAKAGTGASQLYADMLLSMLPNSTHKVNMSYWCYKADRDDFFSILELMEQVKKGSQIIWEYEIYVSSHKEELLKITESK